MQKQTGNIISPEFYSALEEKATTNIKLRRELGQYVEMSLEPTELQLKRGRVGRNEPCPCNSGKKFKNCCCRSWRSMTAIQIVCKILQCCEHELDPELIRRIESVNEMIIRVKPESYLYDIQVIASIVEDYLREFPCSDLHKISNLKHTQLIHWSKKK